MTQAINDHCFELSMQRTSIQNVTSDNPALMINSALKISFIDVIFCNNSAPLMLVIGNLVEFRGHVRFSWNSGYGGVILYNCAQINIYSNSTIEFSNNNVMDEDILNIYNDNNQHFMANSGTGGDDISIIVFINNIVNNGGIMVLDIGSRMRLSNTLLIFQNNKCLTSANRHSGILLVLIMLQHFIRPKVSPCLLVTTLHLVEG